MRTCWRARADLRMCWCCAASKPATASPSRSRRRRKTFCCYLACPHAGAVYLPLNTAYTLTSSITSSAMPRPRLIVCDPSKREGLAEIAAEARRRGGRYPRRQRAREPDRRRRPGAGRFRDCAARGRRSRRDPLLVGHTGRSKGAMLTHQQPRVQRAHAGRLLALHRRPTRSCTRCRSIHTHGAVRGVATSRCCRAARCCFHEIRRRRRWCGCCRRSRP